MSGGLRVAVESEAFELLRADVAAAPLLVDDRPLRGDAGRADWRLCGLLSRLVRAGRVRGDAGEAVLVASVRGLRSPRLLLLGLGPRADLDEAGIASFARDAVGRAVDLGCASLVLSSPRCVCDAVSAAAATDAVSRGALAAMAERSGGLDLVLRVPGADRARSLDALRRKLGPGGRGALLRLAPADVHPRLRGPAAASLPRPVALTQDEP